MYFPLTTITLRLSHVDPLMLYRMLGKGRDYCALLESATHEGGSDYSFLALGNRDVVTVREGRITGSHFVSDGTIRDPLESFDHLMERKHDADRLHMGYIGFLSYESARFFENIQLQPDLHVPDAHFFLPEVLVRIDHCRDEVSLIAHADTHEDLKAIKRMILQSSEQPVKQRPDSFVRNVDADRRFRRMTAGKEYESAVEDAKEKIQAGEVFQVVLSQELELPMVDPVLVFEHLRALNPSPYMYLFRTPELTIVGASPETLIRIEGDKVLYRPIAGTRKRTGDESKDRMLRNELLSDEKERCEHQMLVDLGRNDVGRIAAVGSVEVRNAFRIEAYAHVYHIVSDIVARLREDKTPLDALRAVFPAGTLTGAPKVRAMEIIRDTENAPRGIYGGAFGYIDLSGDIDFAIMIRSMLFADHVTLRVGAGIVTDSVPEREDQECMNKARSCLLAVANALSSSAS
jgi:anthranilate synthase component 1